jgi:hypothetical protein
MLNPNAVSFQPTKFLPIMQLADTTHHEGVVKNDCNSGVVCEREHSTRSPVSSQVRQLVKTVQFTLPQAKQLTDLCKMFNFQKPPQYCYNGPDEYPFVNIDKHGTFTFLIGDEIKQDPKFMVVSSVMYKVHNICLNISRFRNSAPAYLTNRYSCVDPYEMSWAIQIHLFLEYMQNRTFTVITPSEHAVDKKKLELMVADALNKTLMLPINKAWVFCIIKKHL